MSFRKSAFSSGHLPALMVLLISASSLLFGYIPGRGSNGRMLRRDPGAMPFQFRLNDQTGPGLANMTPDSDPVAAVNASFQAWQNIPTAGISFAPLTMTSEGSVQAGVANLVTFTDTQANRDVVGGALAVTRISFNLSSPYNTITRTDITFNPGYKFSTTLAAGTFDIQSVCTHEIGHALGSDHSAVLEATMFQATGMQQSHLRNLAPDDIAWASMMYPKPETAAIFGGISGTVRLSGAALYGAHVVAFDDAGTSMVGALTGSDGTFYLGGLPPGLYMLYAEPLDGPVQKANLGSSYSGINTSFPSIFLGSPESPQVLSVAAGQAVSGVSLDIGSAASLMNIEIGGRTTGQSLSGGSASYGSFTARPGEKFNIVLGGSSLTRVTTLSQIKLFGSGVRIVAGAALQRITFGSGLPGLAFPVEVLPDAAEGAHSLLAGDGTTYSLFSGGLVVVGAGGSSTSSTTLPVTSTTAPPTSTTLPPTTLPTTTTTTTTRATTSTTTSTSTTTTRATTSTTTSTSTTTTRATTSTTTSTSTTTTRATTSTTTSTSTTTTRATTSTTTSTSTTTTTQASATSTTMAATSTTQGVTTTSSSSTSSTTATTSTTLPADQAYGLNFPFLYSDTNLFTGVALANNSVRAAHLTITAYNSSGARLSGTGVTNPASVVLQPTEQSALIVDQIFRFPINVPQKGWFEVSSDNPAVTGFYLIGDYTQQFLDGSDAASATSTDLVIPGIMQSVAFGTEISIVNPDSRYPAQVTANLFDEQGQLLGSLDRTINPHGRIYGTLPSLFGVFNLPLGHLEIQSDRGLTAGMICGDALRLDGGPANRLAVLRAQPRTPGPKRLFLPQYVVGGGWDAHIFLANAGPGPATVRLSLLGTDGRPLALPAAKTIAPHSSVAVQPSVFGLPETNAAAVRGYLRVDVEGGSLAGTVYFEDVGGSQFLSGMNAVVSGATETYISQVATGDTGYYTGVACVNISEAEAQVQVILLNAAGQQVALGKRNAAPGQRFSELLDQLTGFSGTQQGGYIRILSTQPVVCFGVVGTENSLASVPAQVRGQ